MPSPSRAEMDKVRKWKDDDIKKYLHRYFMAHNNVTPASKAGLDKEVEKKHAAGEIADFNVQMQILGEQVMVSIPIKSGHESGSEPATKFIIGNLHQLIRPTLDFGEDNTVVFPLILGYETVNATELITQLQYIGHIPVRVYHLTFFCKLMKREGYI